MLPSRTAPEARDPLSTLSAPRRRSSASRGSLDKTTLVRRPTASAPCLSPSASETSNKNALLGRVDSNHRLPDPESGHRNFGLSHELWLKFKKTRGAGPLPT